MPTPVSYTQWRRDPSLNPWGDAGGYQRYQQYAGQVGGGGGVPGGGGGLQGAAPLPGTYSPTYGGVPGTTSPGASFQNLLQGILGGLSGVGPVIGGLTSASSDALRHQYSPGYFGALDTVTGNVQRRAAGDVSDLDPDLQQRAAEWGVANGIINAPAVNSKYLRDLGLTRYKVERDALDDLQKIKSGTPTVQPFDASSLVPGFNAQAQLQQLADTLRSSGIPEFYQNALLRLAQQGLNRGYNSAGSPVGGGGYGGGGGGNQSSASIPAGILQRYGPASGINPPPMPTAPSGPGWGQAWNDEGGYAGRGVIPQGMDVYGPNTPSMPLPNYTNPNYSMGYNDVLPGPAYNDFNLFDTSGYSTPAPDTYGPFQPAYGYYEDEY